MYVSQQQRRDTAANWTANNPVLLAGEIGIETDTDKAKVGDGTSTWTGLSYWQPAGTVPGSGTVTNVSVASANGFAGTVANPSSTPAVTVETTVTGLLKGNGTAVSAATPGTDYVTPSGSGAALTGITAGQVGADTSGAAAAVKGLPLGLTGATATTRYVGATASGHPVTGTFALGDLDIDQSGSAWVCTVAGSPGTWVQIAGGGGGAVSSVFTRTGAVTAQTGDYTAAQVGALPAADDLSAIATANATAGNVAMNSHKLTGLANGSVSSDSAAYGQTPAGGTTVTIGQGGTGQVTQQAALDVIAGAVTSGSFLRGSGTHVSMSTIQIGDVPTLNQSTTGNAATATNLAGGATFPAYVAPTVTALSDGSSVALNAALGNDFRWSLGGSSHTLATPSNPVNGQSITIAIKYTGSFTPLFTSAVYDFGAAGQPSWSATSGKTDYAGFRYDSALNAAAGAWAYMGSVLGLTS